MGTTRDDGSQPAMWVATADLPRGAGHPFFERLNQILGAAGFDAFVETLCAPFYATMGRPSLAPGRYFRLLLLGYFEGLDSERAIAWRAADSLSLRAFLRLAPPAAPPDHSTISRTRRLLSVETHQAVFTWVLQQLADAGLVRGKTVGIDATTLEANAALRSIVRRDTGEDYTAFLARLAEASGIATPTRAELARFDRSRKQKKTSNADWTHPHDPDAKIAKMKDGRTHLAHKAEQAVDLETGAIVGVTVQGADTGDTTTLVETLITAGRAGRGGAAGRCGYRRSGRRQGVPQQRDAGGLAGGGAAHLPLGAGSGPPMLARPAGGPRRRVCQPAPDSRGAGPSPAALPGAVAGAAVCASVRNRWDAAGASSGASQHPEAAARACRRLQPRAAPAAPDRRRHAPEPSGPGRGPILRPDQAVVRPVGPSGALLDASSPDVVANGVVTAPSDLPAIPFERGHFCHGLLSAQQLAHVPPCSRF